MFEYLDPIDGSLSKNQVRPLVAPLHALCLPLAHPLVACPLGLSLRCLTSVCPLAAPLCPLVRWPFSLSPRCLTSVRSLPRQLGVSTCCALAWVQVHWVFPPHCVYLLHLACPLGVSTYLLHPCKSTRCVHLFCMPTLSVPSFDHSVGPLVLTIAGLKVLVLYPVVLALSQRSCLCAGHSVHLHRWVSNRLPSLWHRSVASLSFNPSPCLRVSRIAFHVSSTALCHPSIVSH